MLQTGNYSLLLLIQLSLLAYDLFVNSFSELLRGAPVIQLVLFIIQDISILFNMIIILLMMFNTYVFQVGLVSLLLERFRALLVSSVLYLTLSICFHCWVLVCHHVRMKTSFLWQHINPNIFFLCLRTSDGLGQTVLFGQMVFSLSLSSREQVLLFTSSKICDIHTNSVLITRVS
uniref:Transmembrane protein 138 n=1 Tax=Oryzias melastigma TaxID=30732 RepID=A0A3B3CJ44_ORYME